MKTSSFAWLYIFIVVAASVWVAFNLWAFNGQWPRTGDDFAFILLNLGMACALFLPVLIVLLGKKVLPAVDELIYPDRSELFRRSDNLILKMLRLNGYAAAIKFKRTRRLNPLPVDLRTLPDHLRLPIIFYHYWLVLMGTTMVIGSIAFGFLA